MRVGPRGAGDGDNGGRAATSTFFRLHPADADPAELLDPERQRSEPWGGVIFGRCDKCEGSGRTEHECESCRATGARADCPACRGEVRYVAECPACAGAGEIDDSSRDGVSVFPQEDGLYRYLLKRGADIGEGVVVELEGVVADEEDFDADDGALLIHPRRIIASRPPDWRRIDRLRRRLAGWR